MPISKRLSQLLKNMAPPERAEVEAFAAFVIARRKLRNLSLLTDDIYSIEDGEGVKWSSEYSEHTS